VTGSSGLKIIPSTNFRRTLNKVHKKRYKKNPNGKKLFDEELGDLVEKLADNHVQRGSRPEPWPAGSYDPEWDFRKIDINLPQQSGAAEQGRLMYLVSNEQQVLVLLWIYTHADFEGRPPDKDIRELLNDLKRHAETPAASDVSVE
jgi:hypothetical protein